MIRFLITVSVLIFSSWTAFADEKQEAAPSGANCGTFGDAMKVVATKVNEISPVHGDIAMEVSCGAADACSASSSFEIIAMYDDNTGVMKSMVCRFLDPKECASTVCVVNHANIYR